uniref:Aquaporin n=1 Tax=Steinernema glaseri TaxID=37863 RepID=A0A1I7Z9X6_9BILA
MTMSPVYHVRSFKIMSHPSQAQSSTLSVDLDYSNPRASLRNTKGTYHHRNDKLPQTTSVMPSPIPEDDRPFSLITKMVAEFVGDMIFVFIGSLSGLSPVNSIIHAAFAHGITIFVLVASLGHVSGGHFNPAVTLSIAMSRKMNLKEVPFYWAAQLSGGFMGAILVRVVLNQDQYNLINGGATMLSQGFEWYQGLIAEFLLTFILTQCVLLTAVDTSNNVLAPLAIGLTLTLDIFAAGIISGASMNPARSFGPCLGAQIFQSNTKHIWTYHYIYWVGPFLGAALAAGLHQLFFGRGNNRLIC